MSVSSDRVPARRSTPMTPPQGSRPSVKKSGARWVGQARFSLAAILFLPTAAGALPFALPSLPWEHALLGRTPAGETDGIPPDTGEWIVFHPLPLPEVDTRSPLEAELRWLISDEGPLRAAEDRAESWLGLDELEFGSTRLTMQKELGGRIHVQTFTGYRASSQREVRIEYDLGYTLSLRSEARERGESAVSLRSDLHFW
jgi:hypothetical protein